MDDRTFIQGFEGFHNGRFLGFTALALLVFAVVVGLVAAEFRHNDVAKSTDAMTLPNTAR